jgi:hypothetical protein
MARICTDWFSSPAGLTAIYVVEAALIRFHIDADLNLVVASAQDYAAHRTNIAVIPAPGERDMTLERYHIVRRIHIQPTDAVAIDRDPGVRSIRSYQSGTSRRGVGSQVSANVPGGQAQGSQTCDLQMSEVLTDTTSAMKYFLR